MSYSALHGAQSWFPRQICLTLTVGILAGFSFSLLILNASSISRSEMFLGPPPAKYSQDIHDHKEIQSLPELTKEIILQSHSSEKDNESLAADLTRRVRVLCWVLTGPQNHVTRNIYYSNLSNQFVLFMVCKYGIAPFKILYLWGSCFKSSFLC